MLCPLFFAKKGKVHKKIAKSLLHLDMNRNVFLW